MLAAACLAAGGAVAETEAKSGCRKVSGAFEVSKDFGKDYHDLVLDLTVADPWGIDSVSVELKDKGGKFFSKQIVELSDGKAKVAFSDVAPYETYAYDLILAGERRGADVSYAEETKEVQICVQNDWFAFRDGEFFNASKDDNVLVTNESLTAEAFSPRGLILPVSAAANGTEVVTVESAVTVAGALRESALNGLDATSAQTVLTVARFERDDNRAWVCRLADGTWTRLSGCSAENGTYDVRIDHDYRKGVKTVSYSVKPTGVKEWAHLSDEDGQSSFALAEDAKVMANASLLGGAVSSIAAICKSKPKAIHGLILYFR